MQIVGLGTDIVEVDRIRKVLSGFDDHFKERLCTPNELAAAGGLKDPATYFAGRWAAKEAAAKALGCGIGKSCSFTDIIITNDAAGRPELRFAGSAAAYAARIGVQSISISISHENRYAVATVILCG